MSQYERRWHHARNLLLRYKEQRVMENRIQEQTHHNDRFVFAKFVNEEACYGRAKKSGEGQGQVDNCNLLHRESNRLHVNRQVGQKR